MSLHSSVIPNHPSHSPEWLQMGKNCYNHIEIVYVTCPNILKKGRSDRYHEKFK